MDPRKKIEYLKHENNLDRVEDCRTFLFIHGFTTMTENEKIKKRVEKWLKKNNCKTKMNYDFILKDERKH